MVQSEKLSKPKPFGILRFVQFRIIFPADGRPHHRSQEEQAMFARLIQLGSAFLFASVLIASSPVLAGDNGIVTVRSAYPIGETINRLKRDIADKGIKFFDEIDQSKLAADAGIPVGVADLREPATRYAIHHGKCQCRTRLAGAASGLRER